MDAPQDDATILDAVDTILKHSVSGCCVVDENDKLIGVLSELDCLRAIVEPKLVDRR